MGTPFPNPRDEESEGAKARPGPGRRRAGDLLAAPPPPPPPPAFRTKYQYAPLDRDGVPGPSGIKQCFRTVKSARRVAVLADEPGPSGAPSSSSSSSPSARAKTKKHCCKHCNKKFNSPGKLSQHVLSHTGELPFGCQDCDKRFNSKFKLVRHGLIHSETRPFACRSCDKTFHRKDHLVNHERVHNPAKSVYVCERENCRKQYTSSLSFKKHAALHSAEEGNLECKICSEVFENRADIVYHLKVHAGSRTVKNETDKKFDCSDCSRKFFTAKDVRRHMVVHTGRRDFSCQFCSQKFGRKDHLVRHVKKAHPVESKTEPEPEEVVVPLSLSVPKSEPEPPEETLQPYSFYIVPEYPPLESDPMFAPPMLEPPMDAILIDEGEHDVPDPGMEIMQMFESGTTVLPTFTQAFQNAAQSPKPPPQHPPN